VYARRARALAPCGFAPGSAARGLLIDCEQSFSAAVLTEGKGAPYSSTIAPCFGQPGLKGRVALQDFLP
jgi:hypothetical protein